MEENNSESVSCSECPYFYECDNVGAFTTCKYEKGE